MYKHKLTLAEALTGYKVPLKNVDGKTLVLENDEGKVVQSGMLQVISGAGMPRGSGSDVSKIPEDDPCVMFDVEMPQSLKSEDIEKLKEIFDVDEEETEIPDDAVKTAPKNAGRVPFRLDVDIDDDDDRMIGTTVVLKASPSSDASFRWCSFALVFIHEARYFLTIYYSITTKTYNFFPMNSFL